MPKKYIEIKNKNNLNKKLERKNSNTLSEEYNKTNDTNKQHTKTTTITERNSL